MTEYLLDEGTTRDNMAMSGAGGREKDDVVSLDENGMRMATSVSLFSSSDSSAHSSMTLPKSTGTTAEAKLTETTRRRNSFACFHNRLAGTLLIRRSAVYFQSHLFGVEHELVLSRPQIRRISKCKNQGIRLHTISTAEDVTFQSFTHRTEAFDVLTGWLQEKDNAAPHEDGHREGEGHEGEDVRKTEPMAASTKEATGGTATEADVDSNGVQQASEVAGRWTLPPPPPPGPLSIPDPTAATSRMRRRGSSLSKTKILSPVSESAVVQGDDDDDSDIGGDDEDDDDEGDACLCLSPDSSRSIHSSNDDSLDGGGDSRGGGGARNAFANVPSHLVTSSSSLPLPTTVTSSSPPPPPPPPSTAVPPPASTLLKGMWLDPSHRSVSYSSLTDQLFAPETLSTPKMSSSTHRPSPPLRQRSQSSHESRTTSSQSDNNGHNTHHHHNNSRVRMTAPTASSIPTIIRHSSSLLLRRRTKSQEAAAANSPAASSQTRKGISKMEETNHKYLHESSSGATTAKQKRVKTSANNTTSKTSRGRSATDDTDSARDQMSAQVTAHSPNPMMQEAPQHHELQQLWKKAKSSDHPPFKETAIQNLSLDCDLDVFFRQFIANDAVYSIERHQRAMGDSEISTSPWTPMTSSRQEGVESMQRTVKFRHPLQNTFGPSSTRTTKEQVYRRYGPFGIIMETRTFAHDVPSAECFHVADQWIIENSVRAKRPQVWVQVRFQVRFTKTTLLRTVIESKTLSATRRVFLAYSKMLQRAMEESKRAHQDATANHDKEGRSGAPNARRDVKHDTSNGHAGAVPAGVASSDAGAPKESESRWWVMCLAVILILAIAALVGLTIQISILNGRLASLESKLDCFLEQTNAT